MNLNGPYDGVNPKYTAILDLSNMLADAGLKFDIRRFHDGYQVSYPDFDNMAVDAVQHWASYGEDKNLIQIMFHDERFPGCAECDASVEGYLTAKEVFDRIVKYHDTFENDNGGDK